MSPESPEPAPPTEDGVRRAFLNEGKWPENLPSEEQDSVQTFAEAFTRAIAKETTLSPDKLSLADYKQRGGPPLIGSLWEHAWRNT